MAWCISNESAGHRLRNAQLLWAMRRQDPLLVPAYSPTRTSSPLSLHAANIMWNQKTSTVR